MPKFSVIVPIYNVEKYLCQCIDSILSQAYTDFELILVDDGSPDRCPEICDEYAKKDNRIKVIHKTNGGLVSARQAGCAASTGDYVLNVDGDDWVAEDYFARLDLIARQYQPDCICFGSFYVGEDQTVSHPCSLKSGLRYGPYNREDIEKEIFPLLIEGEDSRKFNPSIWAKVFKREIYTDCQMALDKRIKIGEDHACTKPAIYRCRTLFIMEDCLYNYRINPLSMTKGRKVFSWGGPELIGRHFEKQISMKQCDFQDQVNRFVVHNLFNVAVSQFHRKESYRAICRDIDGHLKQPYYRNAISHCKFRSLEGISAKAALQLRLYRLLKWKAHHG